MMPIVIEKEHLVESSPGHDKSPATRQPFRRADFEVTGLHNPLEKQLNGLTPIGIQVVLPGVRIRRQLLGREQPAAVLCKEGHELSPATGCVTQQEFRDRKVSGSQRLLTPGAHHDPLCGARPRAAQRRAQAPTVLRRGGGSGGGLWSCLISIICPSRGSKASSQPAAGSARPHKGRILE